MSGAPPARTLPLEEEARPSLGGGAQEDAERGGPRTMTDTDARRGVGDVSARSTCQRRRSRRRGAAECAAERDERRGERRCEHRGSARLVTTARVRGCNLRRGSLPPTIRARYRDACSSVRSGMGWLIRCGRGFQSGTGRVPVRCEAGSRPVREPDWPVASRIPVQYWVDFSAYTGRSSAHMGRSVTLRGRSSLLRAGSRPYGRVAVGRAGPGENLTPGRWRPPGRARRSRPAAASGDHREQPSIADDPDGRVEVARRGAPRSARPPATRPRRPAPRRAARSGRRTARRASGRASRRRASAPDSARSSSSSSSACCW